MMEFGMEGHEGNSCFICTITQKQRRQPWAEVGGFVHFRTKAFQQKLLADKEASGADRVSGVKAPPLNPLRIVGGDSVHGVKSTPGDCLLPSGHILEGMCNDLSKEERGEVAYMDGNTAEMDMILEAQSVLRAKVEGLEALQASQGETVVELEEDVESKVAALAAAVEGIPEQLVTAEAEWEECRRAGVTAQKYDWWVKEWNGHERAVDKLQQERERLETSREVLRLAKAEMLKNDALLKEAGAQSPISTALEEAWLSRGGWGGN